MKRGYSLLVIVALCAMMGAALTFGSTNAHGQTTDMYSNFVGHWVGYNESLRDGKVLHTPLTLTVSEDSQHGRMRFDYVYSEKGNKDYDVLTRFVAFSPATGKRRYSGRVLRQRSTQQKV